MLLLDVLLCFQTVCPILCFQCVQSQTSLMLTNWEGWEDNVKGLIRYTGINESAGSLPFSRFWFT